MSILDKTLAAVASQSSLKPLKIKDILLSNYFNIIKLTDGNVGCCLNYHQFPDERAAMHWKKLLLSLSQHDPLLLDYLFHDESPNALIKQNLKCCLVSALSKKLLRRSTEFKLRTHFVTSVFRNVRSALIIGFGGYMDHVISCTKIEKIHISDLNYDLPCSMDRTIKEYAGLHPHKRISVSNGSDTKGRIKDAELILITGSALANGTMDRLIDMSGKKTVVVQGPSAAIYPGVLFEKGVRLVSTHLHPKNSIEIAQNSPEKFRSLFEGALPKLFIQPKNAC